MLNVKSFALAGGVLWGAMMFLMTWASIYFGYGSAFLDVIASIYPGYTLSAVGSVVGLIYGFIDGFIGFFIFAWLYNRFSF